MGKFQKVGLAIIFASGIAFAVSGPWWYADAPYGQVAFPWVVECQDDDEIFNPNDSDNLCYKTLGGWWFGYIAGPAKGTNVNGCRVDMAGQEPGSSTTDNYVKAYINDEWVTFVGPDNDNCQGPDVTNRANGDSYLANGYLGLKFGVGEGWNGIVAPDGSSGANKVWEPSIAAVAVNFSTPSGGDKGTTIPVFQKKNMSEFGGFCLKYKSDHSEADDFRVVLGWDETGAKTQREKYDPWRALIPEAPDVKVVDFKWDPDYSTKCTSGKKCNNFEQDQWSDAPIKIEKAITEMMSFKIVLQNYTPMEVNFELHAFGPAGSCGQTPTVVYLKNAPSVNFALSNRALSASIAKPAMVQIYNLQGTIVQSQTLTPNSNIMNLGNLPSGVYMVRAPSLGYSSKIVIK